MALTPFDYSKNILQSKEKLPTEDYVPFIVNRALSYHPDTIMYAQEMNINNQISNELQYDYLFHSIRKMKRKYVEWNKKVKNDELEAIQSFFGCSVSEAKAALRFLSKEQKERIKKIEDSKNERSSR